MAVAVAPKKLIFTRAFQTWVQSLAKEYNAPVYLVGSALARHDPRDIDIRVVLTDEAFEERYGSVQEWMDQGDSGEWGEVRHKWSDDCINVTDQAIKMFGVNIDFQVEPASEVERRYKNKPHMRLA